MNINLDIYNPELPSEYTVNLNCIKVRPNTDIKIYFPIEFTETNKPF